MNLVNRMREYVDPLLVDFDEQEKKKVERAPTAGTRAGDSDDGSSSGDEEGSSSEEEAGSDINFPRDDA